MKKKEFYKHILPHFQQPGQAYFVTWSLKDAIPAKALKRYSQKLEILKSQLFGAVGAADSNPLIRPGVVDSNPPIKKNADRSPHHPGVANSDSPEIQKIQKRIQHPP